MDSVKNYLLDIGLRTRLLVIFLLLLILSTGSVGLTSYLKAKETTMGTIENRLVREVELMGDLADNLNFTYVSDRDYFMQQLEISVRSLYHSLADEGMDVDFLYVSGGEVIPFQISKDNLPEIPINLVNEIASVKKGVIHQDINRNAYTFTVQEMDEIDGVFVLMASTDTYMKSINQMAVYTIIIVLVCVLLSAVVIYLFVRNFTKPLSILRVTMRRVRDGNLEEPEPIKTTIPELNSLYKSYYAMIQQMRSTIHKIKGTTTHLQETGIELQQSSTNTLESTRDVVDSIQVVKEGAEQTASSSENGMESFRAMKIRIDQMMEKMEQVFTGADSMNDSAVSGDRHMMNLMETLRSFEKDFEHLTMTIQEVQKNSSSIHELIDLIQGIAEQTKLLSLNARIEAARAGEAGSGFAVVANEVGKLAEQSSVAALQITESISNMQEITDSATSEFDQMLLKTHATLDTSNESKQSIDVLMAEINKVNTELHSIQDELKGLDEILPSLEQDTESFLSVSQETLASAEEMLASSENQKQQVESTHEIGNKLSDISSSLKEHTEQFKLD